MLNVLSVKDSESLKKLNVLRGNYVAHNYLLIKILY